MATPVLIPVREYLSTTYRPDRDYIDGELLERNLGEQPHAHVQGLITAIFYNNRKEWGVRPLPEQRLPNLLVALPHPGRLRHPQYRRQRPHHQLHAAAVR